MNEIKSRIILKDGTVICDDQSLIEVLYSGNSINDLYCSDKRDQDEWKFAAKDCDSTETGPHYVINEQYTNIVWNDYWFTPEPYSQIDLKSWCYQRCTTNEERERVNIEMIELEKRNMVNVMRHLIYCVDIWRKNKIVWGVGRGSSVSSFILFLIGINRINPIKYNLDISEWLKNT